MVREPSIYLWGRHKTGGLRIAGEIIRYSSTECAGCLQISKDGSSQLTALHPSIYPSILICSHPRMVRGSPKVKSKARLPGHSVYSSSPYLTIRKVMMLPPNQESKGQLRWMPTPLQQRVGKSRRSPNSTTHSSWSKQFESDLKLRNTHEHFS